MFSKIISALKQDDSQVTYNETFASQYELNPNDVQINVDGVGLLHFPIQQHDIQNLLKVSSPAKFGLREQTLLDTSVRDTQEISANQLHIQCNDGAFENMLDDMRDMLGLSENAKLTAHLHNMLIYEAGQFFKPHQDSEKLDGMVATLVVILPSPHIGGDLIIDHNKNQYRFVSEHLDARTLKCLAFYADCHHEVETIREGYRVALTYNLVLEPVHDQLQEPGNAPLKQALREYFVSEEDIAPTPLNFVYYLDHDYTEHSLRWNMLKGVDRQNALAFRAVAKKLDLIPHLALVELHESWTSDGDEDNPDPEDLIDDSTDLTFWLGEDGRKLPYRNYSVDPDEVCWTKDTDDFEPVETEHEGWMGNYGNTIDYWYRRAAVVLWRKSDQIAMEFNLSYDAALARLLSLIHEPGHESEVLATIEKAGGFLRRSSRDVAPTDYKSFVQLACYIQNNEMAQTILADFYLTLIDLDNIAELVKLQQTYGISWCLSVMENWMSAEIKSRYSSKMLFKNMNGLVQKARDLGLDLELVVFLLQYQLNSIFENNQRTVSEKPVERAKSLNLRVELANQLIKACSVLSDDTSARKLIDHLISTPDLYSALDLADILFECQNDMVGMEQVTHDLLCNHVIKSIQDELNQGLRSHDDWSINDKLRCQCEYCNVAQDFLSSHTESKKVWPIAMGYRDHIINSFFGYGLPVNFSVEKTGSPHKLVMVKTDELYHTAKERFDKIKVYSMRLGCIYPKE